MNENNEDIDIGDFAMGDEFDFDTMGAEGEKRKPATLKSDFVSALKETATGDPEGEALNFAKKVMPDGANDMFNVVNDVERNLKDKLDYVKENSKDTIRSITNIADQSVGHIPFFKSVLEKTRSFFDIRENSGSQEH